MNEILFDVVNSILRTFQIRNAKYENFYYMLHINDSSFLPYTKSLCQKIEHLLITLLP